jgi:hypothetical protein
MGTVSKAMGRATPAVKPKLNRAGRLSNDRPENVTEWRVVTVNVPDTNPAITTS